MQSVRANDELTSDEIPITNNCRLLLADLKLDLSDGVFRKDAVDAVNGELVISVSFQLEYVCFCLLGVSWCHWAHMCTT